MKYTNSAYILTCITNMHAGSGDANYGVIDNLVQRDSITNMPVIHSSSLKGALREHFKEQWGEDSPKLNYVFGKDTQRAPTSNDKSPSIGFYKFFDAQLFVLPVRSNKRPFFRGSAEFLISEINKKAEMLGVKNFNITPFTELETHVGKARVTENTPGFFIEELVAENGLLIRDAANDFIGSNPALLDNDDFKQLAEKLPVIARNQLDNGESKNLWYEEVVPRESRFVFFVAKSDEEDIVTKIEFDEIITSTVQVGANASIGYGYTEIRRISDE